MICKAVTRNNPLTDDLVSEVYISFLNLKPEFIQDIIDRDKFYAYIYGMANIMFWRPKSKFFQTYRTANFELLEDIYLTEEEEEFDINDYLNELGLDSNEKLWIKTCLNNGFNYSLVASKTKISRPKISQRIDFIKNKYKK